MSRKRETNPAPGGGQRLPLLPLKDAVVFPHMVVPLLVGRPASLAAVEESVTSEQPLFLCTQQDPNAEEPAANDMYRIGVAANILQTLRMPDGTLKVVVEGLGRGKIEQFCLGEGVAQVVVKQMRSQSENEQDLKGLMRLTLNLFGEYARLSQRIAPEILMAVENMDDADVLADTMCAYLSLRVDERQQLLEMISVNARLERIAAVLMRENELMEIEKTVRERVREQMERSQRDHYLHEQLKVIHQELGNRDEAGDEFSEIKGMIAKAKMPKEVREKAEKEYTRYERMPLMSPEASVIRTYLEWLCEMPWDKRSKDEIDLKDLPAVVTGQDRVEALTVPVATSIDEMEKQMIVATLNSVADNKARAAELLGISKKT
ncbi:MAG: LON peptidase substrate-binding domain-containing protein, partial [Candidatus Hydrogenedentes bacterium]|nr:LON peptidase substrate-binding domain-containing protein [Candidatus Hydrogenedentota bacterium]